jgi:hypothetical protein
MAPPTKVGWATSQPVAIAVTTRAGGLPAPAETGSVTGATRTRIVPTLRTACLSFNDSSGIESRAVAAQPRLVGADEALQFGFRQLLDTADQIIRSVGAHNPAVGEEKGTLVVDNSVIGAGLPLDDREQSAVTR